MSPSPGRTAGSGRPPRRKLFDDTGAAPVPEDLEKWEKRGGYAATFVAIGTLVFYLESLGLHLVGKRVPDPHHKGHFVTPHINLVPEFWVGVGLSVAVLFATYYNRRQILAFAIVLLGLNLSFFAAMFALPFVILGVWMMLRHSRRIRQLAAQGKGPAARRARGSARPASSSNGAAPSGSPEPSKRYTPPKKRKTSPGPDARPVGIGRGGMIRGDLPRKDGGEDEPGGLLGRFAGRKPTDSGEPEDR